MEYEDSESVSHSQIDESMEWCESSIKSPRMKQMKEESQEDRRRPEECQEGNSDKQRYDTHTSGKIKKRRKVIQTNLSSVGNFLKIRTTLPDQLESGKAAKKIKSTNKKSKGKGAPRTSKSIFSKLDKTGQTDQSYQLDQSHNCGGRIEKFFRPVSK